MCLKNNIFLELEQWQSIHPTWVFVFLSGPHGEVQQNIWFIGLLMWKQRVKYSDFLEIVQDCGASKKNSKLNRFSHRLWTKFNWVNVIWPGFLLWYAFFFNRLYDINPAALNDWRQRTGALPGHVQRRWQLLRRGGRKQQTKNPGTGGLLLRLLVRAQCQPFVHEFLLPLPAHAVHVQHLQPGFCQSPVGFPPPCAHAEAPGPVQQAGEEEELCSSQRRRSGGSGWGSGRRGSKRRLSELVRRNSNGPQALTQFFFP